MGSLHALRGFEARTLGTLIRGGRTLCRYRNGTVKTKMPGLEDTQGERVNALKMQLVRFLVALDFR